MAKKKKGNQNSHRYWVKNIIIVNNDVIEDIVTRKIKK